MQTNVPTKRRLSDVRMRIGSLMRALTASIAGRWVVGVLRLRKDLARLSEIESMLEGVSVEGADMVTNMSIVRKKGQSPS